MTEQKFFVKTMKNEIPIFERVFSVLPDKPTDWSAHPKNKSTMDLAISMFYESTGYPVFLKTGMIDSSDPMPPKPDKMKKVAHDFVKNLEEACDMADKMSEDDWESPAEMKMDGKSMWKTTKGGMAWGLLIDLIHHRGQLSTHIRPQGGKVPAIYGPSGDDKGMM
jgi:hypothetical protein